MIRREVLAASVRRELSRDEAVDILLTKPCDLDQKLLRSRALEASGTTSNRGKTHVKSDQIVS